MIGAMGLGYELNCATCMWFVDGFCGNPMKEGCEDNQHMYWTANPRMNLKTLEEVLYKPKKEETMPRTKEAAIDYLREIGWMQEHDRSITQAIPVYDECEIHDNCTVEIWTNSKTGEQSVGWWEN